MLKLNFLKHNYNLKYIMDAFMDNDISNFKGDEDFLKFLVSYTVGNHISGPDENDFKEYADYDGILNIMLLDDYGYFGKKIYQIYELCGKDKLEFIRTCNFLGRYSSFHAVDKEIIDANLALKEPVSFIDYDVTLTIDSFPDSNELLDNLWIVGKSELEYELIRSLKHRINESILKNGDDIPLFEEEISYAEKERLKQEERERKKVPENYEIDIDNLYFGTSIVDFSGGFVGINMKFVSWFENTNIVMLNNSIFRSIPDGEYCLVDKDGNIVIP